MVINICCKKTKARRDTGFFYLKNLNGFTLVELMVVVSIIGILSAISIPLYQTYQAKTRTSEAKLALAAVYSSINSFKAEANGYASCLYDTGYRPANYIGGWVPNGTSGQEDRFYTIGFNADSLYNPSLTGTVVCNRDRRIYRGTKKNNSVTLLPLAPAINSLGTAFTAQAVGTVEDSDIGNSAGTTGDSWTIDQDKILIHNRNGY